MPNSDEKCQIVDTNSYTTDSNAKGQIINTHCDSTDYNAKGQIIDTHCHLTDERLFGVANEIIANFDNDNIESVISVGYDMPSSVGSYKLATCNERVYCALGFHPHDSKYATAKQYEELANLSSDKKVVAIGEIGLDYFYDHSLRDVQKRVFIEQIELANSLELPVILHIRDAYDDARKILFDNLHYLKNGLVLHCYSGSVEYVKIFDKIDAYYSFGGAITFRNAKHNLDALATVPKDRLMFETDSPYMTPTPYRGKTNTPKLIDLVADKAAEVLDMDEAELVKLTTKNAKTLFSKIR